MSVLHDSRLPRPFYARPSAIVARELLGQRLVRLLEDGQRLSGLICETEAYGGPDDEASHAYRLTRRSAIMYGPPGHAYVYFIYGMHYCLNVVTVLDGQPGPPISCTARYMARAWLGATVRSPSGCNKSKGMWRKLST